MNMFNGLPSLFAILNAYRRGSRICIRFNKSLSSLDSHESVG